MNMIHRARGLARRSSFFVEMNDFFELQLQLTMSNNNADTCILAYLFHRRRRPLLGICSGQQELRLLWQFQRPLMKVLCPAGSQLKPWRFVVFDFRPIIM